MFKLFLAQTGNPTNKNEFQLINFLSKYISNKVKKCSISHNDLFDFGNFEIYQLFDNRSTHRTVH